MSDAPSLPWTVQTQTELASARVLIRELGLIKTVSVGWKLRLAQSRGAPFEDFPPADSIEETLSRQQIGPAIVLYRLLMDEVGPERALSVTEAAVIEGAVRFLGASIGRLDRATLGAMTEEERGSFARRIGRKFFNATVRWDTISGDEVAFTVTACRFARLCVELGEPQLAPVFCKGDAHFFGSVEPNVLH